MRWGFARPMGATESAEQTPMDSSRSVVWPFAVADDASRILCLPGGRRFALDRPLVMAILNATPDSFSDGGRLAQDLDGRIRQAVAEGADLLDVGGEST